MRVLPKAGVIAIAALALFAASEGLVSTSSAAAAEPLRGQWHLDESCPGCTSFADTSGNGLTATGTAITHVGAGRFGAALAFPTKSASVSAGDSPLLQPSTVTLLAWVRAGSTPSTVRAVAAQGADGSCGHASYALYTGGSLDASGLRFYIWNGSVSKVTPAAANGMWDGQWHLVTGTYDGAFVRLYVDGVEVGSGTPASGSIGYGLAGNNKFTIGNYGGAAECIEDTNFSGDVDEVRVYSRALTATEIGRLAASSGPTPPELISDTPPPSGETPQGGQTPPAPPAPPAPPTARFSASPNPTCVDSDTVLDGSASTPGDGGPITRYEYFEGPVDPASLPLATGAVAKVAFPWSGQQSPAPKAAASSSPTGLPSFIELPWIRTPAAVTLRVTDSAGRQGSVTHTIDFLQKSTTEPRTGCPPVAASERAQTPRTSLLAPRSSTVDTSSLLRSAYEAVLACNSNSPCAGNAVVIAPRISQLEKQMNEAAARADDSRAAQQQARDRKKAALDAIQKFLDAIRGLNPQLRAASSPAEATGAASKRKAGKPQIIGQATYTVPAHGRLRLRIHLQSSATKFLRKWKSLNVGSAVVEAGPTGKLRVKTKLVTLKPRTRRK